MLWLSRGVLPLLFCLWLMEATWAALQPLNRRELFWSWSRSGTNMKLCPSSSNEEEGSRASAELSVLLADVFPGHERIFSLSSNKIAPPCQEISPVSWPDHYMSFWILHCFEWFLLMTHVLSFLVISSCYFWALVFRVISSCYFQDAVISRQTFTPLQSVVHILYLSSPFSQPRAIKTDIHNLSVTRS